MKPNTVLPEQFCLRWRQEVPTGAYCWYLRRLASDLRFWGYVHIRTDTISENRSFSGVFPPEIWTISLSMISRIRALGMDGIASTEFSDTALLEGDAGTGTALIRCNATDIPKSEGAKMLFGLISHLQPFIDNALSRTEKNHDC